jgi:catechol 2,3-dioxygenase-like lactoylglutathione lyase family enzyme
MKRMLFAAVAMVLAGMVVPPGYANEAERPHIYGIAGARVFVSKMAPARAFFQAATGTKRACDWCGTPEPSAFRLPSGQFLLLSQMKEDGESNLLAEISFNADHLKELSHLLKVNKIHFRTEEVDSEISMIRLRDPEGHALAFLEAHAARQYKAYYPKNEPNSGLKERMIHAGWVVKDRATMDHFYKDILGFHEYWSGGMKDGETDWVDMQVPDGTDWIEYMLNVDPNADKKELGVMNHIALGVPDVRAAAKELEKNGVKLTEEPQIGRDGKWQLNLYDPDDTRVELMEFAPVEKPCCAEYTGKHPKP